MKKQTDEYDFKKLDGELKVYYHREVEYVKDYKLRFIGSTILFIISVILSSFAWYKETMSGWWSLASIFVYIIMWGISFINARIDGQVYSIYRNRPYDKVNEKSKIHLIKRYKEKDNRYYRRYRKHTLFFHLLTIGMVVYALLCLGDK